MFVTRTSEIYLNNNIVHVIISESSFINYNDAIDNHITIKKITNNKKHTRLIDVRAKCFFDESARRFNESKIAKNKIIAQAVLVGGNTRQEVIDYFSEMGLRRMPVKIFIDYNSAIEWLMSLRFDKKSHRPTTLTDE